MSRSVPFIYLSGAMSGVSEDLSREWRNRIKDGFDRLGVEYECFDPWDHFSFNDPAYDPKEAMQLDLWYLKQADVLVAELALNPNSLGTMSEMAIAYSRGVPIIGIYRSDKELHEWQYDMVNVFFDYRAAEQNCTDIYSDVAHYIASHYRRSSFG